MFRARLNPAGSFRSRSWLWRRSFTADHQATPHIRFLVPTLWTVAACSTIYLGCAAYEVYQDVQHVKAEESRRGYLQQFQLSTLADLEHLMKRSTANTPSSSFQMFLGGARSERPEFSDSQKLATNLIAATVGAYFASAASPALDQYFVHSPRLSRNYTLLTSTFGHAGLLHLGCNMYGLWMLLPVVSRSQTFQESNPHMLAFYLSAGIISSLATTATTLWPRPTPFMSAQGASGALFALLGVVGVSFPDAQISILFLPGTMSIGNALIGFGLFDAIGIFVRYPYIRFAHSAHLGGLLCGVAYANYGGHKNIWRPGRRVAFRAMRTLRVI